MSPTARKFVSTVVTLLVAGLIFAAVLRPTKPAADPTATPTTQPNGEAMAKPATGTDGATPPSGTATPPTGTDTASKPAVPVTPSAQVALTARPPSGSVSETPAPIGSLDPSVSPYQVDFSPNAAGIRSIVSADFWRSAADRFAAAAHRKDPSKPMPVESERHVLASATPLYFGGDTTAVPVLGAHSIVVNGVSVDLFGRVWSELAPGHFATELVDADGKAQFRVERQFTLKPASFDLALRQSVTNLGTAPATVRWIQYGPSEVLPEAGATIEVRRFHFGYLHNATRDKTQSFVVTTGQMVEHPNAAKVAALPSNNVLWRNADAVANDLSLSWFASTSRYFAFAIHAPQESIGNPGGKSIRDRVEQVTVQANGSPIATEVLLLSALHSPDRPVAPGATESFDLGVYAGPLDPDILGSTEPYESLAMSQAIVYQLLSCWCYAFCAFPWLANLMAGFLAVLHDYVVFDWGLAIIVLVIVVRTLLHPLMKSSQIKMQRFGRAMAELKPELDALQKRYKDDPKTLQMEQMRLYREKHVNPAGCVSGILPTFLQMPIWISLYAVLYLAFNLRQAPAFFSLFQNFGGWTFLGDLSRPDNFVEFSNPLNLGLFSLKSINLLPLLLGVVFYIQQKYMTPPTANLTPEQETQQKMMKVMMIGLFPIMMYAMPSGLTLYILTSTCIGIVESKRVKAHIDKYGLADPPKAKRGGVAGGMASRILEKQKAIEAAKLKSKYKERD